MNCPYCKSTQTRVVDKRDNEETNTTRRRRECTECEKRFTTYERIERVLLTVIKRDGRKQEFDREKLKRSILKALSKRQVDEEEIDNIVEEIEHKLLNKEEQEIESKYIGKLVLQKLNKIDKLGALLFAAVYKEFENLADVQKELKKLSKK